MSTDAAQSAPAPLGTFLPGPVLLLGAPGVGKGTQAQRLMAAFAIPQISTGDLLRDHRARHTKFGLLAETYMKEGRLVPDDLVNEMVADRLTLPDTRAGFILDGYPRTIPQAAWLDVHLRSAQCVPVVAIRIEVGYDALLHRITGRRTCPVCNSIYNVYSNRPKIEGICDLEGAVLVRRTDDSEEVFVERMKTFDALTAPVIEHYRGQGRFAAVDGDQTMEAVASAVAGALRRLRGARV